MTGASFNPRTRMGCDDIGTVMDGMVKLFQSTHPHGVRPKIETIRIWSRMFQSTHPHGVRRYWYGDGWHGQAVSIHAPAWGATKDRNDKDMVKNVSIHAPAWGATGPRITSAG